MQCWFCQKQPAGLPLERCGFFQFTTDLINTALLQERLAAVQSKPAQLGTARIACA